MRNRSTFVRHPGKSRPDHLLQRRHVSTFPLYHNFGFDISCKNCIFTFLSRLFWNLNNFKFFRIFPKTKAVTGTLTSNWQLIVQQIIVFFRIAPVVKTSACDAAGRRTVSSQVAMACGRSCSISHHTFKLNCVTNPESGSRILPLECRNVWYWFDLILKFFISNIMHS